MNRSSITQSESNATRDGVYRAQCKFSVTFKGSLNISYYKYVNLAGSPDYN